MIKRDFYDFVTTLFFDEIKRGKNRRNLNNSLPVPHQTFSQWRSPILYLFRKNQFFESMGGKILKSNLAQRIKDEDQKNDEHRGKRRES